MTELFSAIGNLFLAIVYLIGGVLMLGLAVVLVIGIGGFLIIIAIPVIFIGAMFLALL
jgi:hypothetical protein